MAIACQQPPTTGRNIGDYFVTMVVEIVPRQPVKMVVIREFDGDSLLAGEGFNIDYTKSGVDFDDGAKNIGVDLNHSGR